MSVYGWWRALDIFFPSVVLRLLLLLLHHVVSVCLFGWVFLLLPFLQCTNTQTYTHTHPFTKFEIWFLISSNITGSTAAAATHLVSCVCLCAHTKWRNRSYYTERAQFFPRFWCRCFFASSSFSFSESIVVFWLPSYFLLTFDAYVFLLAQSSIRSFFSVSAPCRVSVSFFVVCSSMKLHWFRNFIILYKIMRLCCLLACAPALSCVCLISSSWNTVSSAIIYIRYNELQSNVHQDFSSSAPSFFSSSLITFFCFFLRSFLFIFEVHLPQFYRRCCCCCCF